MINAERIDSYNGIAPGMVITTYHKGYHVCTGIQRRILDETEVAIHPLAYAGKKAGDDWFPMIFYKKLNEKTGKVGNVAEKCCDQSYCRPARKGITAEMAKLESRRSELEALLAMLNEDGTIKL